MTILIYALVAFVISYLLSPLAIKLAIKVGGVARENKRTIHKGLMPQMGGVAIYTSFLIVLIAYLCLNKVSNTMTIIAMIAGGTMIFTMGVMDDIKDLKPMVKLVVQIIAALFVIYVGDIGLESINLFFLKIDTTTIKNLVSLLWIVGITNAINLIDGLDGLASGISTIVLIVTSYIGFAMGKVEVACMCVILIGAILGFLPFNFYPAKSFLGDCGAEFLGFMLACLSILDFKASTFITLGFPIIILFVPIADTLLAIIRRTIKGQSFSTADKSHLHHVLMYKLKLGHKKTVLILYLITFLFGMDAIIIFNSRVWGIVFLIPLFIASWIFIEYTGMINPDFHPILSIYRKLFKK